MKIRLLAAGAALDNHLIRASRDAPRTNGVNLSSYVWYSLIPTICAQRSSYHMYANYIRPVSPRRSVENDNASIIAFVSPIAVSSGSIGCQCLAQAQTQIDCFLTGFTI